MAPTLVIGHRTWGTWIECFSLLSSFHNMRRWYAGWWGRKVINNLSQVWILWATIAPSMTRYAKSYKNDINVMKATNCFLIGFKTPQRRKHTTVTIYKSSQEIKIGQIIGHVNDYYYFLLYVYIIKLPSKFVSFIFRFVLCFDIIFVQ